jgi:Co/Zn/Cd efflux system component
MATQRRIIRAVLFVALANLTYFFVEFIVALNIGSVSLLADAVDFLEDAAINILVLIALGWSALNRSRLGKVLSISMLLPAGFAIWQGVQKILDPVAPDSLPLALAAFAGLSVNLASALTLMKHRNSGGALITAAWLFTRNDAFVSAAILTMALVTFWVQSGWPDLVLGLGILLLNLDAAKKVWDASEHEGLEAKYSDPDSAPDAPPTN